MFELHEAIERVILMGRLVATRDGDGVMEYHPVEWTMFHGDGVWIVTCEGGLEFRIPLTLAQVRQEHALIERAFTASLC